MSNGGGMAEKASVEFRIRRTTDGEPRSLVGDEIAMSYCLSPLLGAHPQPFFFSIARHRS